MPPLSCATSLTRRVKFCFLSSVVSHGVKWWMQSRVDEFLDFLSHSTSIQSSSSPSGAGPAPPLRFFGLLGAPPAPSSALRFPGFPPGGLSARVATGLPTGLVGWLPPASGLVARLVPFVSALVPEVDLAGGFVRLADVGGLLTDEDPGGG